MKCRMFVTASSRLTPNMEHRLSSSENLNTLSYKASMSVAPLNNRRKIHQRLVVVKKST